MEPYFLMLIALLLLVVIPWLTRCRRLAAVRQIMNRKKQNKQNKENKAMKELAKQFIDRECLIYTITSDFGSIQGVIKEINDGGLVIERKSGEREIINLDYVIRIRDYPRKKNGKKKEIILD